MLFDTDTVVEAKELEPGTDAGTGAGSDVGNGATLDQLLALTPAMAKALALYSTLLALLPRWR
jgi:hypothetical protein